MSTIRDIFILVWCAAMILVAIELGGCKGDPPPAPKPVPESQPQQPPKPLIVIVSGKGQPALRELANMLRAEFPQANFADFQTGADAWRAEVTKYLAENPHSYVVAIGHSWGVSCLFSEADALGDVRLFVALDGCRYIEHPRFIVTPNIKRVVNVSADFSGLFRETIHGPQLQIKVKGGHASMTKTPEVLEITRLFVAEAIR
jgi:hypothetical protein